MSYDTPDWWAGLPEPRRWTRAKLVAGCAIVGAAVGGIILRIATAVVS